MAKGLKDPCRHVAEVGQYKIYNSLIFINFISRSKKVKSKMLTCVWRLCSANKLLRLWHFFIILNLKFLDQLERKPCKDTPFFRPFYIGGAPKGPFLWGLTIHQEFFSIDACQQTKSFQHFIINEQIISVDGDQETKGSPTDDYQQKMSSLKMTDNHQT